jgi:hypothetical protein
VLKMPPRLGDDFANVNVAAIDYLLLRSVASDGLAAATTRELDFVLRIGFGKWPVGQVGNADTVIAHLHSRAVHLTSELESRSRPPRRGRAAHTSDCSWCI